MMLHCNINAAALLLLAACNPAPALEHVTVNATPGAAQPKQGVHWSADRLALTIRVRSVRATRVEVWFYAEAFGQPQVLRRALLPTSPDVWSVTVSTLELRNAGLTGTVFYGYRAWGPNWPYVATWQPGALDGFVADVDAHGNRFNPNKLVFDPYALELSHDPTHPGHLDGTVYGTGPSHRLKDTGQVAPKGVVLDETVPDVGPKPTRALKDDIIYEVHLRGLTQADETVPAHLRGTYAGAALKAADLRSMGITAVEFLPLQETANDTNDVATGTEGDNYWGYMTLNYFSPDRRYASDRSPGGPTRELRNMVKAFHDHGIKVLVDVVYNHTAEGGVWDGTGQTTSLYSQRGLDNAHHYQLSAHPAFYFDNTGIGANTNAASPLFVDLMVDSLTYWKDMLGVDGFRFDLASVLGNACFAGCYTFDKYNPANALNRAVVELGVRAPSGGPGVDLVAEPWAIGAGTYRVGDFPAGWAEWNGEFRDTIRAFQNQLGVVTVTPGALARRIAGSHDLYADDGRTPAHSINFVVAHDGFTLRDVYAYNTKNNAQPWPYGPSDGGENNNRSWDQGGDPARQRQAARNGLALLMLSAGTPMLTAGDEMYRTQFGNNNAYNLDSPANWLDWTDRIQHAAFWLFTTRMMHFRHAHPALRPSTFFTGDVGRSGLKDIQWLTPQGTEADPAFMDKPEQHTLAFRLDGEPAADPAASIYVAINGWTERVTFNLPATRSGLAWYRVCDTAAWFEAENNCAPEGGETRLDAGAYDVDARSVLLLVEKGP